MARWHRPQHWPARRLASLCSEQGRWSSRCSAVSGAGWSAGADALRCGVTPFIVSVMGGFMAESGGVVVDLNLFG